jgi:hypothetical protein
MSDRSYPTFPWLVYEALLKIDPLFRDSVLKDLRGASLSDRNSRKDWPKFHDWLKKKYSMQKPTPPPERQPENGAAGDAAAKGGPLPGGLTLSGVVQDGAGAPLPKATVFIRTAGPRQGVGVL